MALLTFERYATGKEYRYPERKCPLVFGDAGQRGED
jgi:hypothetical protein